MVSEVWSPWCKSKETPESAVAITIVKQESTGNLTSPLAPSDTTSQFFPEQFYQQELSIQIWAFGAHSHTKHYNHVVFDDEICPLEPTKRRIPFSNRSSVCIFWWGDQDNQYSELLLKSKHWFLIFCFYFIVFHDFLDFLCLMSLLESFIFFSTEVSWLCLCFSSV